MKTWLMIVSAIAVSGCMPAQFEPTDLDVGTLEATESPLILTSSTAGLTARKQEQTMWCWVAVTQAVAESYGISIKQCEIATLLARDNESDCCVNGGSSACNHPGDPDFALRTAFGIEAKTIGRPLTESELREQLTLGQPVIVGHNRGKSQHLTVINGFDGDKYELLDSDSKSLVYNLTYSELLNRDGATWFLSTFKFHQ